MNKLKHLTHDHAGRLGLVIGLVGGCTAIVLSKVGMANLSGARRRNGSRLHRHVTYPRRVTVAMGYSAGC
jgi:hypothetical protein